MPSPQILARKTAGPSSGPGSGCRALLYCPSPAPPPPRGGGRSLSPATPHAKRKWRRERRATFNPGAAGEGEGRANTTLAVTTPCSAAANACRVASNRPSAARPIGAPPPPASPYGGWGGGWAAGCHYDGGAGAGYCPCHCGSGIPHGSASSPVPCGGAWAPPSPPRLCWSRGPAKFFQESPPLL